MKTRILLWLLVISLSLMACGTGCTRSEEPLADTAEQEMQELPDVTGLTSFCAPKRFYTGHRKSRKPKAIRNPKQRHLHQAEHQIPQGRHAYVLRKFRHRQSALAPRSPSEQRQYNIALWAWCKMPRHNRTANFWNRRMARKRSGSHDRRSTPQRLCRNARQERI